MPQVAGNLPFAPLRTARRFSNPCGKAFGPASSALASDFSTPRRRRPVDQRHAALFARVVEFSPCRLHDLGNIVVEPGHDASRLGRWCRHAGCGPKRTGSHEAQEKNPRTDRSPSSIFSILRMHIGFTISEECTVNSLVVLIIDALGSPPSAKSPRWRCTAFGSSVMCEVMAAKTRSRPVALKASGERTRAGVSGLK